MQREKYSDTRQNGHFKNHMEEDISSSSELSDAFGHSAHSFEEKEIKIPPDTHIRKKFFRMLLTKQ